MIILGTAGTLLDLFPVLLQLSFLGGGNCHFTIASGASSSRAGSTRSLPASAAFIALGHLSLNEVENFLLTFPVLLLSASLLGSVGLGGLTARPLVESLVEVDSELLLLLLKPGGEEFVLGRSGELGVRTQSGLGLLDPVGELLLVDVRHELDGSVDHRHVLAELALLLDNPQGQEEFPQHLAEEDQLGLHRGALQGLHCDELVHDPLGHQDGVGVEVVHVSPALGLCVELTVQILLG